MPDNLQSDDPRQLWQGQVLESNRISLALIRQRAQMLQNRGKSQALGRLTTPVVIGLLYLFSVKSFSGQWSPLHPLFAVALAWGITGAYFLRRSDSSKFTASNAGFSDGLKFCRDEVERQRRHLRGTLQWTFAPILVAIASFLLALAEVSSAAMFVRATPLISLVILWIGAYFLLRMRQDRALRRELEDLAELENERTSQPTSW
jgi:hypothetical protein